MEELEAICEDFFNACATRLYSQGDPLTKMDAEGRMRGAMERYREYRKNIPNDCCTECKRTVGRLHDGACGKRTLEVQVVIVEDCVPDE